MCGDVAYSTATAAMAEVRELVETLSTDLSPPPGMLVEDCEGWREPGAPVRVDLESTLSLRFLRGKQIRVHRDQEAAQTPATHSPCVCST